MRKALVLGTAATALAGLALVAAPANAADTPVTFTLTGGALSITAPSSTVTLTGGAVSLLGTAVSGSLGTTTVKDERGTLAHSVTVTMAASDFTNGTDSTVISKSNATGWSGVATPSGVAVPVATTAVTPASIGASGGATVLTLTSVLGAGGATYNPTVSVSVPAGATAGTYTGTITQTVA